MKPGCILLISLSLASAQQIQPTSTTSDEEISLIPMQGTSMRSLVYECHASEDFCTFNQVKAQDKSTPYFLTPSSAITTPVEKVQFNDSLISVLSDEMCKNFPYLMDLRVWFLDLSIINNGALDGCKRLKTINLHQNQLKSLDANLFSELTNLESVVLSENYLEWISTEMFESSKLTLRNLDLSLNRLKVFTVSPHIRFWTLETLKLENNDLMDLDAVELLKRAPALTSVGVTGNKFVCQRTVAIKNALKGKNLGGLVMEECLYPDVVKPTGNQTIEEKIVHALKSSKELMTTVLVFSVLSFILLCVIAGIGVVVWKTLSKTLGAIPKIAASGAPATSIL